MSTTIPTHPCCTTNPDPPFEPADIHATVALHTAQALQRRLEAAEAALQRIADLGIAIADGVCSACGRVRNPYCPYCLARAYLVHYAEEDQA